MSAVAGDTSGTPSFTIRPAEASDYPAFTRLFPDLQVDDPLPSANTWETAYVPGTWVAVSNDGQVIAYCYCQDYEDTGYVRNIVVDASMRGRGVGRMLLQALAERLRRSGKTYWRLNVMPHNVAALALYQRVGMRVEYGSIGLKIPWSVLADLPNGRSVARVLAPERDGIVEDQFDLPRGQLAFARGLGRHIWETSDDSWAHANGLACFDPRFPGAFPFRAARIDVATTLLNAMRTLVPSDPFVFVVTENDEALADQLVSFGSNVRDRVLHLKGTLSTQPA